MTFLEAHNLMDLLLDKADQAYFTTAEKDKFLSMAIMEWYEDLTTDYLKNAGQKSHEASKYIVFETRTFKDFAAIRTHLNTNAVTPYPFSWSEGLIYPFYKLVNLRVDDTTDYGWEKVNPMPPGTLEVSDVKDPFNVPKVRDRKYHFLGSQIKIYPTDNLPSNEAKINAVYNSSGVVTSVEILTGGSGYTSAPTVKSRDLTASTAALFTATIDGNGTVDSVTIVDDGLLTGGAGSSIVSTSERLLVSDSPASAKFQMNYFKYPLLSNVAAGNYSITQGRNYGTQDLQLGSGAMAYKPFLFTQSGSANSSWGCSPQSADNIIKKAVRMMTANIESPLYKVSSFEEKRSE